MRWKRGIQCRTEEEDERDTIPDNEGGKEGYMRWKRGIKCRTKEEETEKETNEGGFFR